MHFSIGLRASLVLFLFGHAAQAQTTSLNPTVKDYASRIAELDKAVATIKAIGESSQEGAPNFVLDGKMQFITAESCEGKETCFGNNPDSPYGTVYLPLAPGQAPGPEVALSIPVEVPGMSPYWQLRTDEAVVILGWTPTEVRYVGATPYIFARTYDEPVQKVVFAATDDSLNNLTLRTSGSTTPGVNTLGQFTAIVMASDKNADARARRILARAGIVDSYVNTMILAKDVIRLGWEPNADQLGMLLRAGSPTNRAVLQDYARNPPLKVVRLTPMNTAATAPFAKPALRPIGTGICEGPAIGSLQCKQTLDPALKSTLENVSNEIAVRLRNLDTAVAVHGPILTMPASATENNTAGLSICVPRGSNCQGDNRDTIYGFDAVTTMTSHPDDYILIVGVNHTLLGKTTYTNHSIYDVAKATGVASIGDTKAVVNGQYGIEYFLGRPARTATERKLYAVKISRQCAGNPFCVEIATSGALGIAETATMQIVSRMYLEPSTKVKPHEGELLSPWILRVQPRK